MKSEIVLLVKNWMGPNVQSGKTRWDQTSSLAKMAWDQMSMGPLSGSPLNYYTENLKDFLSSKLTKGKSN